MAEPAKSIDPVTVVVRRRVKKGCEPDFERWLSRAMKIARDMPGFMGVDVIRPGPTHPREYTSIFRFDSVENLTRFEESELRRRALDEVGRYVEADPVWEQYSGLEAWFTAPPGAMVPQPSRFRMAVLLSVVILALGIPIAALAAFLLEEVHPLLRMVIVVPIQIALMTYLVMPVLTRWLARWVYPSGNSKHD